MAARHRRRDQSVPVATRRREVGVAMGIVREGRSGGPRRTKAEAGSDPSLRLPTIQHLLSEVGKPRVSRFLVGETRMAWAWLLIRIYVG